MGSRCANASRRSPRSQASASPRSKRSALPPPARRSSRPGSIWKCRNAATANRARSCPRRRCSQPSPTRQTAISTPPCPGTSAAAAPMCESARESSARRAERRRLEMTSRRQFLVTSAAVGGGLLVGVRTGPAMAAATPFTPNAFIRIESDGQVILVMPYVEMGQGTYTSIPMLIAEELEMDLQQERLGHAAPDEHQYFNPLI